MKEILFECVGQNQFKLKSELVLILESSNYETLTEVNVGQWMRKYLILGLVTLSLGRAMGGEPPEVTPWSKLNEKQKQEWVIKTEKAGLHPKLAEEFYESEAMAQQSEKLIGLSKGAVGIANTQAAAAGAANAQMSAQFKKMGLVPFDSLTQNEKESWVKLYGTDAQNMYQKFQLDLRKAGKDEDWIKKFDQKMADLQKVHAAADKLIIK